MAHTGLACPACEAAGKTVPLMTSPGSYGYTCGAHKYQDTEELMAMKPTRIPVPQKLKKPLGEQAELKLSMNPKLLAALQEKFKTNLATAAVTILTAILDSGCFLVTGFDVDRLQQLFGTKVEGPSKLVGLIFNMKNDLAEARGVAESIKKQPANGSTSEVNEVNGDFVQVSLRIGVDEFMAIKEKAKFNNQQTTSYVAQVISHGLQSGWF